MLRFASSNLLRSGFSWQKVKVTNPVAELDGD